MEYTIGKLIPQAAAVSDRLRASTEHGRDLLGQQNTLASQLVDTVKDAEDHHVPRTEILSAVNGLLYELLTQGIIKKQGAFDVADLFEV